MAKSDLTMLLILILLMEFGMWIFLDLGTPTNILFKFVADGLQGGTEFTFFNWIKDNLEALIGAAGAGIVIGSLILGRNEGFIVYAGLAAVFFSYALVFFDFGKRMIIEIDRFFTIPNVGLLFIMVMMIPIVMLYMTTLLRFWRGIE